jgi:hypothetical protein
MAVIPIQVTKKEDANLPPRRFTLRRPTKKTIASITLLVVIAAAAVMAMRTRGDTWHAVFLTNNQVYFGKMSDVPFWPTVTLRSIYYLQMDTQQLQPQREGVEPQIKIVKFGSELHGPKDFMVIPVSQILFWEELRDDSPILQTIRQASTGG